MHLSWALMQCPEQLLNTRLVMLVVGWLRAGSHRAQACTLAGLSRSALKAPASWTLLLWCGAGEDATPQPTGLLVGAAQQGLEETLTLKA